MGDALARFGVFPVRAGMNLYLTDRQTVKRRPALARKAGRWLAERVGRVKAP